MQDASLPENRLLGGLLIGLTHWPTAVEKALQGLEARHFVERANRVVFGAVAALRQAGTESDLVAVAEHLFRSGKIWEAGGYARLANLWMWACGVDEMAELAAALVRIDRRDPDPPIAQPQMATWTQLPDAPFGGTSRDVDTSFDFGANGPERQGD